MLYLWLMDYFCLNVTLIDCLTLECNVIKICHKPWITVWRVPGHQTCFLWFHWMFCFESWSSVFIKVPSTHPCMALMDWFSSDYKEISDDGIMSVTFYFPQRHDGQVWEWPPWSAGLGITLSDQDQVSHCRRPELSITTSICSAASEESVPSCWNTSFNALRTLAGICLALLQRKRRFFSSWKPDNWLGFREI